MTTIILTHSATPHNAGSLFLRFAQDFRRTLRRSRSAVSTLVYKCVDKNYFLTYFIYAMLYIVATPIGNLKDITLRAIEVLKSVDLIACEDTRHTRILTQHYGIEKPLVSYYEYNKIKRGEYLIKALKDGKDIALVSDAGTPGISDPGSHIIRLAIENNTPLTFIPGPAAFIGALVLSGLATHKFIFEGFLPAKSGARKNRLKELEQEKRTLIFYESPHRLLKTLEDILEVLGDREITIVRELTKKFEEIIRGKASEILKHFQAQAPRGEFILVLAGREK